MLPQNTVHGKSKFYYFIVEVSTDSYFDAPEINSTVMHKLEACQDA